MGFWNQNGDSSIGTVTITSQNNLTDGTMSYPSGTYITTTPTGDESGAVSGDFVNATTGGTTGFQIASGSSFPATAGALGKA